MSSGIHCSMWRLRRHHDHYVQAHHLGGADMIACEFSRLPKGVHDGVFMLEQVPAAGELVTFDEGDTHELEVEMVLWQIDPVRGGQTALIQLERNDADIS